MLFWQKKLRLEQKGPLQSLPCCTDAHADWFLRVPLGCQRERAKELPRWGQNKCAQGLLSTYLCSGIVLGTHISRGLRRQKSLEINLPRSERRFPTFWFCQRRLAARRIKPFTLYIFPCHATFDSIEKPYKWDGRAEWCKACLRKSKLNGNEMPENHFMPTQHLRLIFAKQLSVNWGALIVELSQWLYKFIVQVAKMLHTWWLHSKHKQQHNHRLAAEFTISLSVLLFFCATRSQVA